METLYAGLLVVTGATLLLVGIFLFASGRKLGKQRAGTSDGRANRQFSTVQPSEIRPAAKPTPPKNDLVEKISSVSSEGTVEERQSEQAQAINARHDNHELEAKVVTLTNQLNANEAWLTQSVRHAEKLAERNSKLQTEVADLKQQLQASQAKIQEFEVEQQRLLDQLRTTESSLRKTDAQYKEVIERDSQSRSELAQAKSQIDGLMTREKELLAEIDSYSEKLAASQEPVKELQTTRHRLSATEAENQGLRAANRGLEREIITLKKQLQTKEAQFESELRSTRRPAGRRSGERNWLFRMIATTAAIAIASAIAIEFVDVTNLPQLPAPPSVDKDAANVPQELSPPPVAPKKNQVAKQSPAPKPTPRRSGTFETIVPTDLFTGPSGDSPLIGTLAPGVKINIVNSGGGWLEVRSKQGRTIGFVRQEAAVRANEDRS
jgi:hypothetical protein